MGTIGDTVTACLTSLTGWGWAAYFTVALLVVIVTLAADRKRAARTAPIGKDRDHG